MVTLVGGYWNDDRDSPSRSSVFAGLRALIAGTQWPLPAPATWSDRPQVTGDHLPVVAFASRASCLSYASARRRVGGLPRCTIRSRRMAAYPSVDKANTISRSVTWRGSVLRRSLRNGR